MSLVVVQAMRRQVVYLVLWISAWGQSCLMQSLAPAPSGRSAAWRPALRLRTSSSTTATRSSNSSKSPSSPATYCHAAMCARRRHPASSWILTPKRLRQAHPVVRAQPQHPILQLLGRLHCSKGSCSSSRASLR